MASSREEHRQQNIPQGSYLQEEAVNPWGIEEVPSSSPAQTEELAREARYDQLMEQVVERLYTAWSETKAQQVLTGWRSNPFVPSLLATGRAFVTNSLTETTNRFPYVESKSRSQTVESGC
jgi:hypothetical protein